MRKGGGFPSRMLTRWVSVKDDQDVKQSEFLVDLGYCFANKTCGCRASKEYVGLIPEDPLLVAVLAVSVLVLLSDFPAREM
jgi:hypothetical protein